MVWAYACDRVIFHSDLVINRRGKGDVVAEVEVGGNAEHNVCPVAVCIAARGSGVNAVVEYGLNMEIDGLLGRFCRETHNFQAVIEHKNVCPAGVCSAVGISTADEGVAVAWPSFQHDICRDKPRNTEQVRKAEAGI